MDHSSKPEKTPFLKKLSGKGFYFALAVCIVAIGGVATAAFAGNFNGIDQAGDEPARTTTTNDRAVNEPATGVPDTRPTTTTTTVTTTTTTTTAPDEEANAPVTSQLMVLPMGNQLVKEFSDGKAVYSDTMADFRTHDGADFAGESGDKVVAVSAGKVTEVKEDALWGKTITIDHDHGITSTYCGVTATVKEGDTVKAGDAIGVLSDIPCELLSGHHLHLEIAVNGETVDPVEAIGLEVVPVTTAKGSAASSTKSAAAPSASKTSALTATATTKKAS